MLKIILAIAQRQWQVFTASNSLFFNMIFFPLIIFLIILFGIEKVLAVSFETRFSLFLIPGLLCIFIIGRSSRVGLSILKDYKGTIKLLRTAPISRGAIIIGLILGELLIQVITLLLFLFLIFIYYKMGSVLKLIIILLYLLIISVGFLAFYIVLIFMAGPKYGLTLNAFLNIGFYITSGAFYSLGKITLPFKFIVYANPLTYGVSALKYLFFGAQEINILLSSAILISFSLIALLISVALLNKKLLDP